MPDGRPAQILTAYSTWNDPERIATHRAMSPSQRLALALEASRAALRFATGRRAEIPASERPGE